MRFVSKVRSVPLNLLRKLPSTFFPKDGKLRDITRLILNINYKKKRAEGIPETKIKILHL